MTIDRNILLSVGEIRLKPLKWNTSDSIAIQFSKQNRVIDCVKCFLKINKMPRPLLQLSIVFLILLAINQSMNCLIFASKAELKEIPGVPKKVHKFEIKNLCSEIRSMSKVGVTCQTSPQLRF